MKKLIIALVLLIGIQNVNAQTDPKAQEILKGVSAKYKSLKSYSAKFNVSITDSKNKITEKQAGSVLIKGSKYKFLLGTQEVFCDGKAVWTYLKDANEVQINEPKTDPNAITPTNIFTVYEKGFKSKYISEKASNGKTLQTVELVPEDTKKSYFKIQIVINKTEKYVAQAKIFQRDGSTISYAIETFTPNAAADDATFIFDQKKYPNVEVIDLR